VDSNIYGEPFEARMKKRFLGPYTIPGAALVAFAVSGAWIARADLHHLINQRPAALPSIFIACSVMMIILGGILSVEGAAQRRFWSHRISHITGLKKLKPEPLWISIARRFPDPLERLSGPFLRTRLGQSMTDEWKNAGAGTNPSRYLLLLVIVALTGGLLGDRMAGPLLGVALAVISPLVPRQIVRGRAESNRRRFVEQLPQALDTLAAGLSAGLSFQQAVAYAQEELPQPVATIFTRLKRRMGLGHPVETALQRLLNENPDEALALVVDGITLQRRFGGDMVRMLDETADLLRERIELEREVRAVTTQGRLSGIIVAGLTPVSAGILVAFNPDYIDVLFNTIIGQVLLVFALLLQLIGWAIISRLVRVRY
jgi:tight adherence protein B